jgi:acetyl-CoA acetyltransferase
MARDDVWILGIHMTKFGKHPNLDTVDLAAEAALNALADGGVSMKDMGVIAAGNLMGAAAGIGQQLQKQIGQTGIPVYNVANACATGATALRTAIMAIKAGECDLGLAVGVEKLAGAGLLAGGAPKSDRKVYEPRGRYGSVATVDGRIGTETMPGVFAQVGMEYGHKHGGTTFELFARISEKNHAHSTLNPLAAYSKKMTLDQIMGDVMIAYPNTRPMCSANCDGAAAAVVVSGEKLKTLDPTQRRRAVKVSASVLTTDPWEEACQVLPDVNTLTRLLRHSGARALRQPWSVRRGRGGAVLRVRRQLARRPEAGQRLRRPRIQGPSHRCDRYRQHLGGVSPPPRRGG